MKESQESQKMKIGKIRRSRAEPEWFTSAESDKTRGKELENGEIVRNFKRKREWNIYDRPTGGRCESAKMQSDVAMSKYQIELVWHLFDSR